MEDAWRPEGSGIGGKRSLLDEEDGLEGGVEDAWRPEGSEIGEKRSLLDGEDGPEGGVEDAWRPEGSGIGEKRSLLDEERASDGREKGVLVNYRREGFQNRQILVPLWLPLPLREM